MSGTTLIEGVGKDAPTTTNKHGGKQSSSPYRCDLLPPLAVLSVAKVLKQGADKFGESNWHLTTVAENVNHALTHLVAFVAGDGTDDHLEHAATRILFALDQKLAGRPKAIPTDDPPAKKRIYIAGPISKGDLLDNVNQATEAFTALMVAGFAPFCPHWSVYAKPAQWEQPGEGAEIFEMPRVVCEATADGNGLPYHMWLGVDLLWVEASDAVLRLPGRSNGADIEVATAIGKGIPVFECVEDLIAHFAE